MNLETQLKQYDDRCEGLVKQVTFKVIKQLEDKKELNIENALEGQELSSGEKIIMTHYAMNLYTSAKKSKEAYDKFRADIKPHYMKASFLTGIGTYANVTAIVYFSTDKLFWAIGAGIIAQIVASHFFTERVASYFAKVPYRKLMDDFDYKELLTRTATTLYISKANSQKDQK